MSGLATIRQEPELRPAMRLNERVALKSTIDVPENSHGRYTMANLK